MKTKPKGAVNYLLVDSSGSMRDRTSAVGRGLENCVKKLKAEVPESRLVIVFFNGNYEQKYAGKVIDLKEVPFYAAEGTTHLWGSILRSLGALAEETAQYKSLTVISDGDDQGNGEWCREASRGTVARAVKTAKQNGVNIGLLATGYDGFGLAKTLGLEEENVAEFKGDEKGTERAIGVYTDAMVRSSTGRRMGLTALERAAIDESPEELAAKNGEELVTLNKAAKLLQTMYTEDVNQFFSVQFKKRTPPYNVRTYNRARFHVVSKMVGAQGSGAAYNFLEKKLVPVWVMDKYTDEAKAKKARKKVGDEEGFKSIPLDGILAVRAQGKAFRVKTGG